MKYGDLTRKGSVELPVAGPSPRVQWDFKVNCDLSSREGIAFDFRLDDLTGIKGGTVYMRSGTGWYRGPLMIEDEGRWQTVLLTRENMTGREGKPDGWHRIDLVRIALDRSVVEKTTTAGVADLRFVESVDGASRTVVVRGDWASSRPHAERSAILKLATDFATSLSQAGVPNRLVADDKLTEEVLRDAAVAVLPYNPSLPPHALPALEKFVARGGKLFVLYSLPSGVAQLLGLKHVAFYRSGDNGEAPIGGIRRQGAGLKGQPEFAPQASGNAQRVELAGPGEIVAYWADGHQRALSVPAIFRVPHGVYMSHVWRSDSQAPKRALLRSIMTTLCPELEQRFAAAEVAAAKVAAEVRAFVRTVPGKRGERRLAWCHSARGLGGRHDWDSSIRFLKDMGFTDIIANLSWGYRAYYASRILPVDDSVSKQGDALVACLAACRKYGIKCHVWRVCYNTGGRITKEQEAAFAAEGRGVRLFDAKSRNPWAWTFCPSHPANIALEVQAMKELAAKGVDGIHFDYIRYADANTCFCEGCRTRFAATCGVALTNWPVCVRSDAALAKKWTQWRVSNISQVVKTVGEHVHARHPGVEISVAARASIDGAYRGDGQDWVGWAKNGWVDFLCPMDYTPSTSYLRNTCREQQKALSGSRAKLFPGLGISCWADDGRDAERLTRHIKALRADGIEGFTIFNFDAHAERILPIVREGPLRD